MTCHLYREEHPLTSGSEVTQPPQIPHLDVVIEQLSWQQVSGVGSVLRQQSSTASINSPLLKQTTPQLVSLFSTPSNLYQN